MFHTVGPWDPVTVLSTEGVLVESTLNGKRLQWKDPPCYECENQLFLWPFSIANVELPESRSNICSFCRL